MSILMFSSLTQIVFSQNSTLGVKAKNGNTVMIDILEDNPSNVKAFTLQLPIWHLAGSKINTSILDLKGDIAYTGKGKFNGGISYKFGLLDKIAPDTYEGDYPNHDLVMSINKPVKSQELNLYGTYFFKDQKEEVIERIRLKTEGNVATVTDVKTKGLTRTGLNLGYAQGFTWYNFNNVSINVNPSVNESIEETYEFMSMSSIQDYKFVKLGINRTKMVNLKLNAEGYGKKESSHISVNNFNLILAVQNKFDDVYVGQYNTDNNVVELKHYSMNNSNAKLPVGFEFTHREIYKKSFFSYEYGIKYLPGLLKNINLMVNFGFSVNIDFLRNK